MKKAIKNSLLTFLFTLIAFNGESQDLSKGDSLKNEGEIKEAINFFKAGLQSSPTSPKVLFKLADAFALNFQFDSSIKYLNILIKTEPGLSIVINPNFLALRKYRKKEWEMIESKVLDDYIAKNPTLKHRQIIKDIWHMQALDQAYYFEIALAKKKIGSVSTIITALSDYKSEINKQNLLKIEHIINSIGWPRPSTVGKEAIEGLLLVINHSIDSNIYRKYLPFIKAMCDNKEIRCENYALIYDKYMMTTGKPQLYGSQMIFNSETNQYEPYRIQDEQYVEQRRKEMGMEPLSEYLKIFGSNYKVKKGTL